jgi:hypothetical protein
MILDIALLLARLIKKLALATLSAFYQLDLDGDLNAYFSALGRN